MFDLPFTEPEKTEEEKRGMGVGEEQAFCLGHVNLEMPIINPNENVNLNIPVWSSGERSRLEVEIRKRQCVRGYLQLRLDEITKEV